MGKIPYGDDGPLVDEARLSSSSGVKRPWAEYHVSDMTNEESDTDSAVKTALSENIEASSITQKQSRDMRTATGDDLVVYSTTGPQHSSARNAHILRKNQGKVRRNRRPGRITEHITRDIELPPIPKRQHKGLSNSKSDGLKNSNRLRKKKQHYRPKNISNTSYAALDLGTNNCRLLIAIPQGAGDFHVVDAFSRIVRLGKGLEKSGKLDDAAMDRAIDALRECAKKLRDKNIGKIRLIATEACRRAKNGAMFLERVKLETGLELEVVNRKTEAQLAAEGCGALVDKKADGAVLFDIGGGSSELILLDRRGRKSSKISEQISSWTSLPVGVVTLSERHGGKHVTRKMFDEMVADVDEHILQFDGRGNLDEFWKNGRVHLLGTSGTVTTLAGVHLNLPRYDRRKVDGIWLNNKQIDHVIDLLINMDYQQRAANPCIGNERADLVLAGCAILQSIRKTWPTHRLRVADRGLREGILTQMMNQDGVWANRSNGRNHRSKKTGYNKSRPIGSHNSGENIHD